MKLRTSFSFLHLSKFAFLFLCCCVDVSAVSRSFPVVTLRPLYKQFSPNSDGQLDVLPIEISIKKGNDIEIVDWQLHIYGPNGFVRGYYPDRRVLKSGFFSSKSNSNIPPKTIYWDGRNNKGQIQADGRYRLELRLTHDYNKIERYRSSEIYIQTAIPQISLKGLRLYNLRPPIADDKFGDPVGEILIEQKVRGVSITDKVEYNGKIISEDGQVVEIQHWKGTLPETIKWNGRIKNGEPAPIGVYRYQLEARTLSGVITKASLYQLVVLPLLQSPSDFLSTDVFFVDRNGSSALEHPLQVKMIGANKPRSLTLYSRVNGLLSGKSWSLSKEFNNLGAVNLVSGVSVFDRNSAAGLYRLEATHSKAPVYLMLDTEKPNLQIRISSSDYSIGEPFEFFPQYKDDSPLHSFTIRLKIKIGTQFHDLRTWQGSTLPEKIVWLGEVDSTHRLMGGETLYFSYEATDAAGNKQLIQSKPFFTNVNFLPVAPQLEDLESTIALSGLFVDDSKEQLSSFGQRLVNQIYKNWAELDNYNVKVRVYVSFQGEEDENLLRSEKLSRLIQNQLIKEGIQPDHISFRGEGETSLLSESEDEHSFYINNRVQIELSKIR